MTQGCTPENEGDVILHIEDLSYQVGDHSILKGVSVDINRGDFVAIAGPSGAGKSTLLRLINRLDEPTGGTVYFAGRDYREIPPQDLRRQVGMVMQSAYLFSGTVAENIRFGPRQRGETVPDETVNALLEAVSLLGYADRDISRLSGGEAQRVSLARTLANSPQVLLLDEPTSALDEAAQQDVEELICHIIHEQHLTSLLVTHDIDQARRMANRAILLGEGRVVKIGDVADVLGDTDPRAD